MIRVAHRMGQILGLSLGTHCGSVLLLRISHRVMLILEGDVDESLGKIPGNIS